LHQQLGAKLESGDRVVYLGNYLGHGADPAGAVDELLHFRRYALTLPGAEPWDVVYLRGAQEEMWQKLLQIQFAAQPREVLEWMLGQGVEATLRAYGANAEEGRLRAGEGVLSITRWTNALRGAMHRRQGHDELMAALRRYAIAEPARLLFVHAGVDPNRPLSEQGDTFWWGSAYFDAIEGHYDGFARVVRGYDPAHGGRVEVEGTLSLDGGAGFGGPLYAVCLAVGGEMVEWLEIT
jgi:serine/threonine protein phosphatase 1